MHKSMIQVKVRRPLQFVIILGLLYHVHACMHVYAADKTLNLPILLPQINRTRNLID
jgi:Na+-translocating ferredoxin:NAD+ oxidoreductase RnfE subunit